MFNDKAYSLDDYVLQAKKLAFVFVSKGIKPGATVAILMRNDIRMFEVIEACRYLEVSFLPLNWHATGHELDYILEDSEASILVGHEDLISFAFGSHSSPKLSSALSIMALPTPSNIIAAYTIPQWDNNFIHKGCEDLIHLVEGALPISTSLKPFKGLLAYTSGSTGRPKGIRRTANQTQTDLFPVYEGLARTLLKLECGNRYYIAAPLYHSAPNTLSLCCLAARDVDVFIEAKFDAEKFLADIEKHQITHVYIVPTMMIRLLKLPKDIRAKYDVSSLKFGISSGSAWPAEVKQAMIEWFGPVFYESYGASEIGFMTLISSSEAIIKPGSVGKVLPGGSIKILDDEKNELPIGESGLIYVHLPMFGDFVYSNSDDANGEQQFEGHTTVGDVGYLDEDGYLFINDRKKDMVISGGANIFPAEIEAILVQMEQIEDCALFGIPDPDFGEKLVAAVTCQPGYSLTLDCIHSFLDGKVSRFKYPRKLDLHDSLPREESGKVFKQKLRAQYK